MPNVNNYYSISANDQNGYLSSLESLLRSKSKLDEKTLSRVVNDVRSTLSSMDADRSSSGLQLDTGDSVAKHFNAINSMVLGSIGDKVAKQSVSEGLSSLVQTLQSKAPIISVPVGNPQPAVSYVVQPGPQPPSAPTVPSSGAPKPPSVVTPPVIPSQSAKDLAVIKGTTPKAPGVTPPTIPSQSAKDLAVIKSTTPPSIKPAEPQPLPKAPEPPKRKP